VKAGAVKSEKTPQNTVLGPYVRVDPTAVAATRGRVVRATRTGLHRTGHMNVFTGAVNALKFSIA